MLGQPKDMKDAKEMPEKMPEAPKEENKEKEAAPPLPPIGGLLGPTLKVTPVANPKPSQTVEESPF